MVGNERQRALAKCYQIALARLRNQHSEEFHTILAAVYQENDLTVTKRTRRTTSTTAPGPVDIPKEDTTHE